MRLKFAIACVLLVATGLSCVLSALATFLPDWYIADTKSLKWGLFQLCWNGMQGGCRWHYPLNSVPGYMQASAALMVSCVATNGLSFLITACYIRRERTLVLLSVWLPIFAGGCSFVAIMMWAWPPELIVVINPSRQLGSAFWLALATSCIDICPTSFSAVVLYKMNCHCSDRTEAESAAAATGHSEPWLQTPAWVHVHPPPYYPNDTLTGGELQGPPAYVELPPSYEEVTKSRDIADDTVTSVKETHG